MSVEDIERRAAHSAEWRASRWPTRSSAGDAAQATLVLPARLRAQGERLAGLTYLMAQRLREALAVALRLQAGESVARGQARAADAAARRRALRRRRRARRPRASAQRRSARSPTSSSTRAAARRSARSRSPLRGARRGHDRAARDRDDHNLRAIEAG